MYLKNAKIIVLQFVTGLTYFITNLAGINYPATVTATSLKVKRGIEEIL